MHRSDIPSIGVRVSQSGLERKVIQAPEEEGARRSTSHSRSHELLRLPEGRRASRTELDCVIGRNVDAQAVMTLYNLPSHFQLALLLEERCANQKELANLASVMPEDMHARWMLLTDNGEEFADEDGIGALAGERVKDGELEVHLYYCDPRQSQQKGSCEKNHRDPADLGEGHVRLRRAHGGGYGRAHEPCQLQPPRLPRRQDAHTDAALRLRRGGRQTPCSTPSASGRSGDELMLRPEILDIERESGRGAPDAPEVAERP